MEQLWSQLKDKDEIGHYQEYVNSELSTAKNQSLNINPTAIIESNELKTTLDIEQYLNLSNLMLLKTEIYDQILSKIHIPKPEKASSSPIVGVVEGQASNGLNKSFSFIHYSNNPLITHVQRLSRMFDSKNGYFYSYFFNIYCKPDFGSW